MRNCAGENACMSKLRAPAADNQHTSNKPYTKSSSIVKQVKLNARIGQQPQDMKAKSGLAANMYEDARLFFEKSFGCGICGKMFKTEKVFLEQCSCHHFSPASGLFIGLCLFVILKT